MGGLLGGGGGQKGYVAPLSNNLGPPPTHTHPPLPTPLNNESEVIQSTILILLPLGSVMHIVKEFHCMLSLLVTDLKEILDRHPTKRIYMAAL